MYNNLYLKDWEATFELVTNCQVAHVSKQDFAQCQYQQQFSSDSCDVVVCYDNKEFEYTLWKHVKTVPLSRPLCLTKTSANLGMADRSEYHDQHHHCNRHWVLN